MFKLVRGKFLAKEVLEQIRELVVQTKLQDPQLSRGQVVDLALLFGGQNLEVALLFQVQ